MGTNHTHGDTVVLVDGVLFSGDVAMKPQPSFANPTAKISDWLRSLDRLRSDASRNARTRATDRSAASTIIEGYRDYLTRIRDARAALKKAGKTQDEAVQTVTDEMAAQYPDRNRLAGAIRAAYRRGGRAQLARYLRGGRSPRAWRQMVAL